MWIVQIALRRPYTFVVAALLIILSAPFVLRKMPTDIFPTIDIPVVAMPWQYNGMNAQEISDRLSSSVLNLNKDSHYGTSRFYTLERGRRFDGTRRCAGGCRQIDCPARRYFLYPGCTGPREGQGGDPFANIEVGKVGGEVNVKVVTAHEMKGYEHYIVKHVLLDKDFKFIAKHLFDYSFPARKAYRYRSSR